MERRTRAAAVAQRRAPLLDLLLRTGVASSIVTAAVSAALFAAVAAAAPADGGSLGLLAGLAAVAVAAAALSRLVHGRLTALAAADARAAVRGRHASVDGCDIRQCHPDAPGHVRPRAPGLAIAVV